jgi:hypothetical protein
VSTNLAPVPSESASCNHCGAPLVADQRYCLSCGQPCSPVRLAFLDVLEGERRSQGGAVVAAAPTVAYSPYVEPTAGPAWMRRYAPLFGVLSVLLLAGIAGLLVGHWATQSKATSGPEVVKVEGLGGLAAAAPTTTTPGTGTTAATTKPAKSSTSAKSEEAKEEAEAKAEEKAEEKGASKLPAAKPLDTTKEKTTGKTKEAEVTHITQAPIEVK